MAIETDSRVVVIQALLEMVMQVKTARSDVVQENFQGWIENVNGFMMKQEGATATEFERLKVDLETMAASLVGGKG